MDFGALCSGTIKKLKEAAPATMTCPYCLKDLNGFDLKKICSICGDAQEDRQTNVFQKMLGAPFECANGSCKGRYTQIKCGKCGEKLPASFAQFQKYMRLAIAAPSGAGKTVYITTMLQDIYANSAKLGLNISPLNDKTAQYHQNNVSRLYDERRTLDATTKGEPKPLQWTIQNMRQAEGNTVPTYSLTIFDGAGEDQANVDDNVGRYLAHARMILLLLDPTKLFGVRSQMTEEEIIKSGGMPGDNLTRNATQNFINKIIQYIKERSGSSIDRKLETPVAITFAKMDMLQRFFPEDAVVFKPSGHVAKGSWDEDEANQVHSEIADWMAYCGDDLSGTFDANFTNWRYFGISSLGIQPRDNSSLVEEPKPLRVLDPLLWNFRLEEII